jgi:hypothetical protein
VLCGRKKVSHEGAKDTNTFSLAFVGLVCFVGEKVSHKGAKDTKNYLHSFVSFVCFVGEKVSHEGTKGKNCRPTFLCELSVLCGRKKFPTKAQRTQRLFRLPF